MQGSRCRTQGPRRSSKWRAGNREDRRYTQVRCKQGPRGSSTSVSGDAIANKHTLCYRLYCRYYQCQPHTLYLVGLRHMLHFLAKLADEFILLLFCCSAVGPELQVLLLPLRLTALKVCQQLQGNVYGQWILCGRLFPCAKLVLSVPHVATRRPSWHCVLSTCSCRLANWSCSSLSSSKSARVELRRSLRGHEA